MTTAAATAAIATSGAAMAQIDVTNPTPFGMATVEQSGPISIVIFDVPGGVLTVAETITVTLDFFTVDDMDAVTVQFGNILVPPASLDLDGDGTFGEGGDNVWAGATTDSKIDMAGVGTFNAAVNAINGLVTSGSAVSAGIRIVATDQSANTEMTVIDTTSGVFNEATDESLDGLTTAANMSDAFYDETNMELIMVWNRSLRNAAGGTANDLNQTVVADVALLAGTDFERADDSAFMTGVAAILGVNAGDVALTGATQEALSFTLPMVDNIDVGNYVRIAAATTSVTDILGNDLSDDQVGSVVSALEDFIVTAVNWRVPVPTNGANTVGALAVTFNLPVDSGQLGADSFYDMFLGSGSDLLDADNSDFFLTGAAVDPMDSRTILLDVDSDIDDLGVADDGLNQDDDTGNDYDGDGNNDENLLSFSLNLEGDREMAANEPQSAFGGPYGGGDDDFDQTIVSGDEIDPTAGAVAYVDCDGDGTLDGVRVVFSEPLDTSVDADDGAAITANTGVTVHPVDMIDLVTGVRTTATTAAMFAMGEDDVDIDSFEFSSVDTDADDVISSRETNNAITWKWVPGDFDWDGDGMTANDAMMADDEEALATTDDDGLVDLDVDGMMSPITDANGNSAGGFSGTANTDRASAVLLGVSFFNGDNIAAGMQKFSEQDGNPGDDANNNLVQGIFTEGLNVGGIDETKFRWGASASDRFAVGDSDGTFGAENNILQLTDNTPNGIEAGDTLTIAADNGVADLNGFDLAPDATGQMSVDRTGPYVALQFDVNGVVIDSAFLVDETEDGEFAERVDLFFTCDLDASTVQVEDFTVQGIDADDLTLALSGQVVSLSFPTSLIPLSSTVTVTYNGAADTTPLACNGNPIAAMNDTVTAREVPTPDVDGEFTAVKNISGTITGASAGTKVFGMIAAPAVKSIRGTVGNVSFVITDSSSCEAVTNVILGLEEFAYMYNDRGDMFVSNEKEDDFDDVSEPSARWIALMNINSNNFTFTARGTSEDAQYQSINVSSGSLAISWEVLGSSDGTAYNLYRNGVGSTPIVSTAVVTDDSGAYLLHMTAPVSEFGGFSATDWPIIIVVEQPTGARFAVSGLLTSINGEAITFNSLQWESDDPSNCIFDIDLADVGVETIYRGWNILKYARAGGYADANNQIPTLPRGVTEDDITVGTDLDNATTLSQFVYFLDSNGDGVWDNNDGGLEDIVVDVNCFEHFVFTMTSRGVEVSSQFNGRVSDDVDTFPGGYAAGFFNGESSRLGVFQFGSMIAPGSIFGSEDEFPNNNVTKGWALVSNNPGGESDTIVEFFTQNPGAEFVIEFDRTSNSEVEISTSDNGIGDLNEVTCQGLFVWYDN